MAHDYKATLKSSFDVAGATANIAEVLNGFDKTINSRIKSPCMQYDTKGFEYDKERGVMTFNIIADILIYYNQNDPLSDETFNDKWDDIGLYFNAFIDALNVSSKVRVVNTENIKGEDFGYGFTVNNFIPVRYELEVKVSC